MKSALAKHRARLAALFVALLLPTGAQAGGFEFPDNGARSVGRGGAYAVGVSDLTALHYNPGALARLEGTQVLWNHNLVLHETSFQRDPISKGFADEGTPFPLAEDNESLFALGGFVAAGSNFGLENWMFAAGVYGPSAVGRLDYDDYGPQSFMLTELDILMIYYSLSAAWQIPKTFGVGVTLQWVDLPRMDYELVIDSTLVPSLAANTDAAGTQIVSKLQLADRFAFSAIVGAWWRFLPNWELGVAGRVIPIKLSSKGGAKVDKPELVTETLTVAMPLTLPIRIRGGVRYVAETFDVELDVFYENWSVVDAYDVDFEGAINGQPVDDLRMGKAWNDTVSVRAGGDWRVLPEQLTLRAGGFWENGATPDNYTHLDFPSFDRFGLGGGGTYTLAGLGLTVAWMHIFQEDRDVKERYGKVTQQRPLAPCPEQCGGLTGVVANAGTFQSAYDLFSLGVDYRF